ncbi:MAG: hypothetical protein DLM53_08385 [Candidatus Eremiobacter antarcticus]|nr:MAG: hypothetical protein DLM53_08385 [Candidatus Eremiobacter sp. RRmetagenome_bin22]
MRVGEAERTASPFVAERLSDLDDILFARFRQHRLVIKFPDAVRAQLLEQEGATRPAERHVELLGQRSVSIRSGEEELHCTVVVADAVRLRRDRSVQQVGLHAHLPRAARIQDLVDLRRISHVRFEEEQITRDGQRQAGRDDEPRAPALAQG